MGLLDTLGYGNQGGYGGLLDMLMYKSPLLQPQQPAEGPQYDPMGMPFAAPPQTAASPFGPVPQMNQPSPGMYQPPSAFNSGATPVPNFTAAPRAPAFAPQAAPIEPQGSQVNDISVGGYQMPRLGSVADYTPQPPSTDISAQSRQPAPQQPQQLPPAFGGNGSVLSRLGSPDGLIARLTGNDTRSVAQQNLKAQYDALVPIVGQQKAMLAVMNPEAGKTILAQALEKQQPTFGVIGEGGGGEKAYGFIDPTKKAVTPYTPPGAADDKGVMGPDGKMIPYPEGVDKKTFRNEVSRANAKAAAGEKTEVQAKAEIFANKMELSNKSISDGVGTSLAGKIASGLPLGNYAQSEEYQKYKQASSNFITALLRQESGAAISKSEFDRYEKEYMPQPGDSAGVLAQKSEARRIAIEGMKKGAGPGYKSPTAPALPAGWSVSVR